jgi:hypothetical protein
VARWARKGARHLVAKNAQGRWVNAVDLNSGGTAKFVRGPWKATYGLGAYGVDPYTHTAWAVINHKGSFAVARDMKPLLSHWF